MPATRKYAIKGVVQGYTGTQLQDDLNTLTELCTEVVYRDGTKSLFFEDDVTKLIIGKACAAVKAEVDTSLKELFQKLEDLLPDDVVKSVTRYRKGQAHQDPVAELQYKMGPLKKVSRIVAKAAHYAICDEKNYNKLQLQQVRDILRATMVFPPSAWGQKADKIGAKMIDTINDHFKGAVIQVKNRFIHGQYPNYAQLMGVNLPDDLKKFVDETFKQTLWGRDSFYRDLQLLIRLDDTHFDNTKGLSHVILELQLASSKMYAGKTHKDDSGASGHDMYKNVRAVSEFCEFLYWRTKHQKARGGIQLPNAEDYYDRASMKIESFVKQSEDMSEMYRDRELVGMAATLANAIDDSEWFKTKSGGK